MCCISFDSYIKPQPYVVKLSQIISCISFDSYIKPQRSSDCSRILSVVYLLIPTSNHNPGTYCVVYSGLYIFWFLHQTTTTSHNLKMISLLYIFWFLHQTTTSRRQERRSIRLYIFWFLHQTTTGRAKWFLFKSCISFDSYIKPQLCVPSCYNSKVVYLLIPTSNHNLVGGVAGVLMLYIFWFLHQTTTLYTIYTSSVCCISFDSYIKPQLCCFAASNSLRCISFDSYIKPQPGPCFDIGMPSCISFDSYIKPQLKQFASSLR